MNSYYKQSVAIFGLAIPLTVMGVLAGGALYSVSVINKKFKVKKVEYTKALVVDQQTAKLQAQVAQNGSHLARWNNVLSTETRGTFIDHWKVAEKKFSGRELTRGPHNWINYSEGIGKGIMQPASQVEMSFSGTYRAMQLTLMEVESKLPQLQLDSLVMSPDAQNEKLNFKTTFTVWTEK
ncbi:hypothetical protein NT6N_35370 [Oceaniferula spumae]|uniref:Uncharacterized protein n=1 Tax=Oceaniferula spumae TaxID=2979115 RepID=A0AAT9FQS3_9BACT